MQKTTNELFSMLCSCVFYAIFILLAFLHFGTGKHNMSSTHENNMNTRMNIKREHT